MHLMNRREQVAYWGGAVLIALFSSAIIVNTTLLQPENAYDGNGLVISEKAGGTVPRTLPVAATHVRVRVQEPRRTARRRARKHTRTASISKVSAPASSPLIMRVQRKLRRMGYDPGPIDGRLGPATRAAIRKFQRANNMPPTGEIEPGVMALLLP
jgi:peptidoglycan hydrolase-like protein with peptidoglycan-binding domain